MTTWTNNRIKSLISWHSPVKRIQAHQHWEINTTQGLNVVNETAQTYQLPTAFLSKPIQLLCLSHQNHQEHFATNHPSNSTKTLSPAWRTHQEAILQSMQCYLKKFPNTSKLRKKAHLTLIWQPKTWTTSFKFLMAQTNWKESLKATNPAGRRNTICSTNNKLISLKTQTGAIETNQKQCLCAIEFLSSVKKLIKQLLI